MIVIEIIKYINITRIESIRKLVNKLLKISIEYYLTSLLTIYNSLPFTAFRSDKPTPT